MSMNRVILTGRITKEIELRKTPNGASVVSFTLASNRRSKQEGQPDADFINCVAWNKTADLMSQYLKKGSHIGIEGRVQTRSYDDKDGKRVFVTEILVDMLEFLDTKEKGGSSNATPQPSAASAPAPQEPSQDSYTGDTIDIASDDLPF